MSDLKLRSAVMLYVVTRYMAGDAQYFTPDDSARKGLPPTQKRLCGKSERGEYTGLIPEFYARFRLAEQGWQYPCSGAPHVQHAAVFLAEKGLMDERGDRSISKAYAPTSKGLIVAERLHAHIKTVTTATGRMYTLNAADFIAEIERA